MTATRSRVVWARRVSFVLGIAVSQIAAADIVTGLIAYYPFEGNANDSSASANHGVEHGTIAYVPGRVGTAVRFDGQVDADYITLTSPLNPTATDYTVAFWMKSTKHDAYIIHSYDQADPGMCNEWETFIVLSGLAQPALEGVWVYQCGNRELGVLHSVNPVVDGNWHHVVFTRTRSTNEITAYLDGVPTGSVVGGGGENAATPLTETAIGAAAASYGSYWFEGQLDEMRIYNRVLAPEDIFLLANPGVPAVSEWGLMAMAVLVLSAGGWVIARRRAVA